MCARIPVCCPVEETGDMCLCVGLLDTAGAYIDIRFHVSRSGFSVFPFARGTWSHIDIVIVVCYATILTLIAELATITGKVRGALGTQLQAIPAYTYMYKVQFSMLELVGPLLCLSGSGETPGDTSYVVPV